MIGPVADAMNEWLEKEGSTRKVYGVRVGTGDAPIIGSELAQSWHNAGECDWIEESAQLDGTCAFEVQGMDARSAIRYALSYWPESEWIALLEAEERGRSEVPEDGAFTMRRPRVVAVVEL